MSEERVALMIYQEEEMENVGNNVGNNYEAITIKSVIK